MKSGRTETAFAGRTSDTTREHAIADELRDRDAARCVAFPRLAD